MNNSVTKSGLKDIASVCLMLLAIGLLTALASCSTDSTTQTDRINDKRIESQGPAISENAKKEAKQMAANMVELASMQQAAYQLSMEGSRRATNPQVKVYAQRVLQTNMQGLNELRQLAASMKIELPTTLSNDGQHRLTALQKASLGVALDLQYLDELGKVTRKAASLADDLADDGTTDAVKQYGKKVKKAQQEANDALKQLKNILN